MMKSRRHAPSSPLTGWLVVGWLVRCGAADGWGKGREGKEGKAASWCTSGLRDWTRLLWEEGVARFYGGLRLVGLGWGIVGG